MLQIQYISTVTEYKKQERSKELAAVEEKLADKAAEFNTLAKRLNSIEDGKVAIEERWIPSWRSIRNSSLLSRKD